MPRLFVLVALFAFLAVAVFPGAAQGAVIYSQGQSSPTVGGNSDVAAATPELFADDFVIPAGGTVLAVSWEGVYNGPFTLTEPDAFTVRFYADGGPIPTGAPLATFFVGNVPKTLTGDGLYTGDVYRYEANLGGSFVASPGVSYWFSVQNDTTADADDSWLWSGINVGIGNHFGDPIRWSQNAGSTWPLVYPNNDLTFELYDDAVPEPSGLITLVLGIGSLCACRPKRSRRSVTAP